MTNRRPARAVLIATVAVVMVGAIVGSACHFDFVFSPCLETFRPKDFLDGRWTLTTVDGQLIPVAGLVLPGSTDKLIAGTLFVNTFYLNEGTCEKPKGSRGQVIAVYLLKPAASAELRKSQLGSFDYDNITKGVTLRALGKAVSGTADPRSGIFEIVGVMDIVAPIPVSGGGTATHRLRFERTQYY